MYSMVNINSMKSAAVERPDLPNNHFSPTKLFTFTVLYKKESNRESYINDQYHYSTEPAMEHEHCVENSASLSPFHSGEHSWTGKRER